MALLISSKLGQHSLLTYATELAKANQQI